MIVTAEILQAVAIIITCWTAIAAIDAWKREFIGKRRIELAEEVLAKFYQVRDSISYIRNPFSQPGEGRDPEADPRDRGPDDEFMDRIRLIWERFGNRRTVFNEFGILKYKFLAAFGKDKEDIFIDVNSILNSIFASAHILGTYYWKRQGRVKMSDEEFSIHLKEMHKHEGIYWEDFNQPDEIKAGLEKILTRLETVVQPCFNPPSTIYEKLTRPFKFLKRA